MGFGDGDRNAASGANLQGIGVGSNTIIEDGIGRICDRNFIKRKSHG
jgi:hypothetical protein